MYSTEDRQMLQEILSRLDRLESQGSERASLSKEYYTVKEVASLLGRRDYTVRQHWCNKGRIDCEKAPYTGKWLIPRREVQTPSGWWSATTRKRRLELVNAQGYPEPICCLVESVKMLPRIVFSHSRVRVSQVQLD